MKLYEISAKRIEIHSTSLAKNDLEKSYDMDIKEKRSSKYSWNNQKTLIYDPHPTAITSLEFLSVTKLFTIALRPDSMT